VADFVHYFWKALHPQRFVQHLVSQVNGDRAGNAGASPVTYRTPKLDFVAEFGAKRQLIDVWAGG
jgi:hypothetical protein